MATKVVTIRRSMGDGSHGRFLGGERGMNLREMGVVDWGRVLALERDRERKIIYLVF